jgi:hypothetical protein
MINQFPAAGDQKMLALWGFLEGKKRTCKSF